MGFKEVISAIDVHNDKVGIELRVLTEKGAPSTEKEIRKRLPADLLPLILSIALSVPE